MAEEIGLSAKGASFFGLFVSVDGGDPTENSLPAAGAFLRKLQPDEVPSRTGGHLLYRKWHFNKSKESKMEDEEDFVNLLYAQVLSDMKARIFSPLPLADKLKAAKQEGDKAKFLKVARKLPGYGQYRFPDCLCDFPEEVRGMGGFASVSCGRG